MEKHRQASECRMIRGAGYGEIVEKKSRFIASLQPAASQEEALAFIDDIRRKYYDARHNCFAYLLREEEMERYSDDGEPGGTAGRPMLEVLKGEGLTIVAAVVTRYFGGTLLGTGGLVRAYTQAVQQALDHCEIVTMRRGRRYVITVEYALTGKLQHLFGLRQIVTEETVYTDQVTFHILVPDGLEETLQKEITGLASARAKIIKQEEAWYTAGP